MLSTALVHGILARMSNICIGVVGDLFLDQYLDLDQRLTEPSLETGLDAYQIVNVVNSPGAAGTVLNNLSALGVGTIKVLSVIGADGRGYDLKRELLKRRVDWDYVLESPERWTPTYTKPMLSSDETASTRRELNRLDLKNRTPTPPEIERWVLDRLRSFCESCDVVLILDQVSEADCGVITTHVREQLSELGEAAPEKLLLADSRERIGLFRHCWTKPNVGECVQAVSAGNPAAVTPEWAALQLAMKTGRPVFCTQGEQGMLLTDPREGGSLGPAVIEVPGYPVEGLVDPVGAGDSTSAGIACAYAAGASLGEAAAFGNLIASITVKQLGTTGAATREMVRERWAELGKRATSTRPDGGKGVS